MYPLSNSDQKSNLKLILLTVLAKPLKRKAMIEPKPTIGISFGVKSSSSMIYIKRDYKIIRK